MNDLNGRNDVSDEKVVRFVCGCGQAIETGDDMQGEEIACPSCGVNNLVPMAFQRREPGPVAAPAASASRSRPAREEMSVNTVRLQRAVRLDSSAEIVMLFRNLAVFAVAICLVGVLAMMSDREVLVLWASAAGGFASVAFGLTLIGQLIFIRAALERNGAK